MAKHSIVCNATSKQNTGVQHNLLAVSIEREKERKKERKEREREREREIHLKHKEES